jgi:hypothetical protein
LLILTSKIQNEIGKDVIMIGDIIWHRTREMESNLRGCGGMTVGKMKGKMRIMLLEGRSLLAFTLRDMNSFMRVDCCCEADGDGDNDDVSPANRRRRTNKSILNCFDWRNKLEE